MKKLFKALFGKRDSESQGVEKKSKKGVGLLTAMVALVAALPTAASAAPIDFSTSGGLGVTTTDAVGTGLSFAGQFDEWTLLVLGLLLAPVAIGFVIWLVRKAPKFSGGKS